MVVPTPPVYWFHLDETNNTSADGPFFIFGGLIATPSQAVAVHDAIAEIRTRYGYQQGDQFKFHTRSRPDHVSQTDFVAAKQAAVALLEQLDVKMIVYVVLHDIAKGSVEENSEKALNALLSHFEFHFLPEFGARGTVTIDRVDDRFGYPYLRTKFQHGISLPDGRKAPLANIVHYSFSGDGLSHFSSLVDISLGAFRYCVNASFGKGKEDLAKELIQPLSRALWSKSTEDDDRQIGGYGFLQYPKEIRVQQYREQYEILTTKLTEWTSD
ncbi:MAG: hypothetical protein ACYC3W_10375 [Candidatus Nanopelagicales bacterium]